MEATEDVLRAGALAVVREIAGVVARSTTATLDDPVSVDPHG
jgi:hypothetical protein